MLDWLFFSQNPLIIITSLSLSFPLLLRISLFLRITFLSFLFSVSISIYLTLSCSIYLSFFIFFSPLTSYIWTFFSLFTMEVNRKKCSLYNLHDLKTYFFGNTIKWSICISNVYKVSNITRKSSTSQFYFDCVDSILFLFT